MTTRTYLTATRTISRPSLSFTITKLSLIFCTVLTATATFTVSAADVAKGEAYFQVSCSSCHSIDANLTPGQGPALHSVVGRAVGSAPKFNYSETLIKAKADGLSWDQEKLDTYLTNPEKMFPGTRMPLNIPEKADRDNVLSYLASLKMDAAPKPPSSPAITNADLVQDWQDDTPGRIHHITTAQLVAPYATKSASNSPSQVAPADGALPKVPAGFVVNVFVKGINPRVLAVAPNGDVFVSESRKGQIKVIHSANGETADTVSVFAEGFTNPYGIAFYPNGANPTHVYIASIKSVVRYPYTKGDLKPSGPEETIVATITDKGGNHWTRSLLFTPDNKKMLLTVGSATNVATEIPKVAPKTIEAWDAKHGVGGAWGVEEDRAAVFSFNPDGSDKQVYATGIRNCVGFAIHPAHGDLLCSVNERDGLGDNLPPDYFSRIPKGSFFGWPWYYLGSNEDPRHAGLRPDLKGKVRVPDVLLQAHSAPLGLAIYHAAKGAANALPKAYEGDVFLALHGSWNRAARTGSKVVRIPMKNGVPTGAYEDFMTGFIINNNTVWGRPASVAVAADGSLLVGDDASNIVWRVTPEKSVNKAK